MTLKELTGAVDCRIIRCPGRPEKLEITGITADSREVRPGNLFLCRKGARVDGHAFIGEAVKNGAAAVLAEEDLWEEAWLCPAGRAAVILTEDTEKAEALLAAHWYGDPAEKLQLAGITGTKGKTTTACILQKLLEHTGHKAGYIGTLGIWCGDEWETVENTTPDAFTIHRSFAKMVEAGCEWAVLEVSSQGIKKQRVYGLDFAAGIFTNFAPDHIGPGEHDSVEEYREMKSRLFSRCGICVGNVEDPQCGWMFRNARGAVYGYGCKKPAAEAERTVDFPFRQILWAEDIAAVEPEESRGARRKTRFRADGHTYLLGMPGEYNVSNALAAMQMLRAAGLWDETAGQCLEEMSVRGRMEQIIWEKQIACYVDYAHNPLSLQRALETLREGRPSRILTVFGCGGGRSGERREGMGEAAGRLSDLTIVTSDNPRMEEPARIMQEIYRGVRKVGGACLLIEDRMLAVRAAVMEAEPGDVVLVAGKGHEMYQEIKGIRYPMDDRQLLLDAWEERRKQEMQGRQQAGQSRRQETQNKQRK